VAKLTEEEKRIKDKTTFFLCFIWLASSLLLQVFSLVYYSTGESIPLCGELIPCNHSLCKNWLSHMFSDSSSWESISR